VLADARDACLDDGMRLRVLADQPAVIKPPSLTGLERPLELRPALTR
jgi:hypothetical protein